MASQVSTYQCPRCTGPLEFSSETGKLECKFCRSSFTVEEYDALTAKRTARAARAFEQKEAAQAVTKEPKEAFGENWAPDMREYSCPDCGAVLAADANTAVICCPYCGNRAMVPGVFSGMRKPDYVIPFKKTRADAEEALRNHYKKKPFLPKGFSAQNQIEKLQGVYVPFWLFDATVEAQVQFDGQIIHERENKKDKVDHYDSRRSGKLSFKGLPVDASQRMEDDLMDSILPYRYKEKKPFSMAYFAGYCAEKFDVSVDECAERAKEQCVNTTVDMLYSDARKKGKYNKMEVEKLHTDFQRDNLHYVMLPVWIVSTRWKDKTYRFAMNGQTGRIVGDLPIAMGKYWRSTILMTVIFGGILSIIASLIL